jgi:DUF971 family protein
VTPWPVSIVDHPGRGELEIRWTGGEVSRLPHHLLRTRCRCAACEQHRRRPDPSVAAPASTVRLHAIHPVGDRGLNLVFDDGHGRGIFPWPYLHELGRSPA